MFEEIVSQKKRRGLSDLEHRQIQFISIWYHIVIYVMVNFEDFDPDPDWIRERMMKKVSKVQIEAAINDLIKLGLIEWRDGRFKQKKGALSVPDHIISAAITRYHSSMIDLAKDALVELPADQREFNGVTIPMNKETLPKIKEKIRQFRREVNDFSTSIENADEVFKVNIQLLPLVKHGEGPK